jgi:hypothetical protein
MNRKIIYNAETGEVVEREMNAEELAQWQADQAASAAEAAAKAEAAAQRQALLDKLGISADEAKLLLS